MKAAKEIYLNSPIRNCRTCAHSAIIQGSENLRECALTGYLCDAARRHPVSQCDENLSGWTPIPPKPPRRSLRQWLHDIFLA